MDDDIKAAVRRQFSPVAAAYATSSVHAGGPDLAALVAAAAPASHEHALDAGSGAGHTALALAPHVASVTAVDLSREMLDQGAALAAERGLSNLSFVRGDVERLEFQDQSFDLVSSRYSAHHYPHPAAALAQIARVLRPGGRFVLVDVVADEQPAHDTFLNAIELLRDPSHVRDHSISQWQQLMRQAGLEPDLLETWPLHLDFTSWIERMRTPAAAAAQIVWLMDVAAAEIRQSFAIEPDHSFTLRLALLRARKH